MENQIEDLFKEMERKEEIKVLYACESGSRAWGFASPDSDYDVRFLYVHPIEWYLSIREGRRDVIELPLENNWDINGWDLQKALKLLQKSNPPLMEWLGSPIVYLVHSNFVDQFRSLTSVYYSPRACAYHYMRMAQGNFREYLTGDQVWTKKYFYVLRPVLAVNWIERGLGIVPTALVDLVEGLSLDRSLVIEINRLLEVKREGSELGYRPRIPLISEFIESELSRFEDVKFERKENAPSVELLDNFFRNMIREVWE